MSLARFLAAAKNPVATGAEGLEGLLATLARKSNRTNVTRGVEMDMPFTSKAGEAPFGPGGESWFAEATRQGPEGSLESLLEKLASGAGDLGGYARENPLKANLGAASIPLLGSMIDVEFDDPGMSGLEKLHARDPGKYDFPDDVMKKHRRRG